MKEKVIGTNPTINEIIAWAEQNGFVVQFRLLDKKAVQQGVQPTKGTGRKSARKSSSKSKVGQPAVGG